MSTLIRVGFLSRIAGLGGSGAGGWSLLYFHVKNRVGTLLTITNSVKTTAGTDRYVAPYVANASGTGITLV